MRGGGGGGGGEGLCRLRDLHGQRSRKVHRLLGDSEEFSVAGRQEHGEVGRDKWEREEKPLNLKLQK